MSDRVITMYLGRIVEESPADEVTDSSRHPYTRALFSATPGLLDPIDPIPLVGPVPSATRPPSGCPFRTRCWKADEVCAGAMPDFTAASRPGHRYRCHHPVEEGQSTRDLVAQALSAVAGRRHGRRPVPEHAQGALMPIPAPLTGVVPPVCTPLTPDREVDVPSLHQARRPPGGGRGGRSVRARLLIGGGVSDGRAPAAGRRRRWSAMSAGSSPCSPGPST